MTRPALEWRWPGASRRAHLFVVGGDGRSLCGRWAFMGDACLNQDDRLDQSDDCKACLAERGRRARRALRLAKRAP